VTNEMVFTGSARDLDAADATAVIAPVVSRFD
jgi:hypothetical protein